MMGVKNRRVRAGELPDSIFERAAIERLIAARDDHRVGAAHRGDGLSQSSERDHLRLIERFRGVYQQQVQIAPQPQVLIPVVQNEDRNPAARFKPLARRVTIAIHDHARAGA
jgi:hypothetical protein